MLAFTLRHTIPATYALLPAPMASQDATALILAIGLHESGFEHRMQRKVGPARGLWQFDRRDVETVLMHRASGPPIRAVITALSYHTSAIAAMRNAVQHNDVLACAFARCLLWTLPGELPGPREPEEAWQCYREAWRPGQPNPDTWEVQVLHGVGSGPDTRRGMWASTTSLSARSRRCSTTLTFCRRPRSGCGRNRARWRSGNGRGHRWAQRKSGKERHARTVVVD